MRKTYFMILFMLLCMMGCANGHSVDEQDSYFLETEVGTIEIEPSSQLAPYTEILSQYTKKGTCYAFVRIAGYDDSVFLISDTYYDVVIGEWQETCVTGKATAYIMSDNKICCLGTLECESPAYSIAIDQLGYLYSAKEEDVRQWKVDAAKETLSAVEGAYCEEKDGVTIYKYFDEATEGKMEEIDNESALQTMHTKYAEAFPVRFNPLIR